MGKSFKESPWKYKNNKNFQKKQKKHKQKNIDKHQDFKFEDTDSDSAKY